MQLHFIYSPLKDRVSTERKKNNEQSINIWTSLEFQKNIYVHEVRTREAAGGAESEWWRDCDAGVMSACRNRVQSSSSSLSSSDSRTEKNSITTWVSKSDLSFRKNDREENIGK